MRRTTALAHACVSSSCFPPPTRPSYCYCCHIAVLLLFPPSRGPRVRTIYSRITRAAIRFYSFLPRAQGGKTVILLIRSLFEKRITFAITYPAYPPFHRSRYYAAINSLTFTLAPSEYYFLVRIVSRSESRLASRQVRGPRERSYNVRYLELKYESRGTNRRVANSR